MIYALSCTSTSSSPTHQLDAVKLWTVPPHLSHHFLWDGTRIGHEPFTLQCCFETVLGAHRFDPPLCQKVCRFLPHSSPNTHLIHNCWFQLLKIRACPSSRQIVLPTLTRLAQQTRLSSNSLFSLPLLPSLTYISSTGQ